jgi:hypothetical protein
MDLRGNRNPGYSIYYEPRTGPIRVVQFTPLLTRINREWDLDHWCEYASEILRDEVYRRIQSTYHISRAQIIRRNVVGNLQLHNNVGHGRNARIMNLLVGQLTAEVSYFLSIDVFEPF